MQSPRVSPPERPKRVLSRLSLLITQKTTKMSAITSFTQSLFTPAPILTSEVKDQLVAKTSKRPVGMTFTDPELDDGSDMPSDSGSGDDSDDEIVSNIENAIQAAQAQETADKKRARAREAANAARRALRKKATQKKSETPPPEKKKAETRKRKTPTKKPETKSRPRKKQKAVSAKSLFQSFIDGEFDQDNKDAIKDVIAFEVEKNGHTNIKQAENVIEALEANYPQITRELLLFMMGFNGNPESLWTFIHSHQNKQKYFEVFTKLYPYVK